MISLRTYAGLSCVFFFLILFHEIKTHKTFFNVCLKAGESNIFIFAGFNFFLALILQISSILCRVFFTRIREIETAAITEKVKEKVVSIVLVLIIIKSYQDIAMLFNYSFFLVLCVLHWLVFKRSEYLIASSISEFKPHFKMILLYIILLLTDFGLVKLFSSQFDPDNERNTTIYYILEIEVLLIMVKGIVNLIKYAFNLRSLSKGKDKSENWKLSSMLEIFYDIFKISYEITLFIMIYNAYGYPIHLIVNIIVSAIHLEKTITIFKESLKFHKKIERLPDLEEKDFPPGMDKTCIICFEEMKVAKKLGCGHTFHLKCLKNWLEGHHICPICREEIDFEKCEKKEEEKNENRDENEAAGLQNIANLMEPKNDLMEELSRLYEINHYYQYKPSPGGANLKKNNQISHQNFDEEQFEKERIDELEGRKKIEKEEEEEKTGMKLKSFEEVLEEEKDEPKGNEFEIQEKPKKTKAKKPIPIRKKRRRKRELPNIEYSVGSVAYGLPCIALTRRTFETEILRKHIEILNAHLIKIYENPKQELMAEEISLMNQSMNKKSTLKGRPSETTPAFKEKEEANLLEAELKRVDVEEKECEEKEEEEVPDNSGLNKQLEEFCSDEKLENEKREQIRPSIVSEYLRDESSERKIIQRSISSSPARNQNKHSSSIQGLDTPHHQKHD